jgi:hypothetical protein
VPELADHRDEVTSRLLMTVRDDGTFTIPPGPAGAQAGSTDSGASAE